MNINNPHSNMDLLSIYFVYVLHIKKTKQKTVKRTSIPHISFTKNTIHKEEEKHLNYLNLITVQKYAFKEEGFSCVCYVCRLFYDVVTV